MKYERERQRNEQTLNNVLKLLISQLFFMIHVGLGIVLNTNENSGGTFDNKSKYNNERKILIKGLL